jgi:hypothetical protein
LPFILSNLFKEEVNEHNLHHRGAPVIDPSEELIGVTNVFLRCYKQFRQTTPARTYVSEVIYNYFRHTKITYYCYYTYILIISFRYKLLNIFKSVFPYRNSVNRLIMDTEKFIQSNTVTLTFPIMPILSIAAATGRKEGTRNGFMSRVSRLTMARPLPRP